MSNATPIWQNVEYHKMDSYIYQVTQLDHIAFWKYWKKLIADGIVRTVVDPAETIVQININHPLGAQLLDLVCAA